MKFKFKDLFRYSKAAIIVFIINLVIASLSDKWFKLSGIILMLLMTAQSNITRYTLLKLFKFNKSKIEK